jgi:hypothetical protein
MTVKRKFDEIMVRQYFIKIFVLGTPINLISEMALFVRKNYHTNFISDLHGVEIHITRFLINGEEDITQTTAVVRASVFYQIEKEIFYRRMSRYDIFTLIIAFDKGDRQSFDDVKEHLKIFFENKYDNRIIPIILLGFITEEAKVTREEGEKLATELFATYFESTTTDKEQIHNIYWSMVSKVLETHSE